VIALFLEKDLLNPDYTRKLLGWEQRFSSLDFIAQVTLHIPPRAATWFAAAGCILPSTHVRPATGTAN
jgi:hypothetical protein